MILAILWIFGALGCAAYAGKQGFGFWKYLIISICLTPIAGLIVFAIESAGQKERKKIKVAPPPQRPQSPSGQ